MLENLYVLIFWVVLLLVSVYASFYFIGRIKDKQERYKLLATMFMMYATVSVAFIIFYFTILTGLTQ